MAIHQKTIHEYAAQGEPSVMLMVKNDIFVCSKRKFAASQRFASDYLATGEDPIVLKGVTVAEFQCFAWFMHRDSEGSAAGASKAPPPGPGRWEAIHRLAMFWEFQEAEEYAKQQIAINEGERLDKNPFESVGDTMAENINGMADEPIGGIANILQQTGKGLGMAVGGAVLLPFAIASLPFIGIHKGIQAFRK